MTIDTTGNVGIGTDTPGYTLDVSGTATISKYFLSGGQPSLLTSKAFGQGTIINWNNSGGNGETDFINSKGGGTGGFNFYNIASDPTPPPTTTPDPLMTISSTGIVTATSFNPASDVRLKENITNLDNSLDKICNIRGVNYNWKNDETKTKTAGVIAQEVLEQIPEAVNNSDSEKLSVNYNSIIAHLIESVKELKREINELKAK
uniref:Peptidase S74 domain-containing protein n=1 Tax=viral metagenome TaxID=1070528 RepID=A0A6C0CLH8_9ZZZZ